MYLTLGGVFMNHIPNHLTEDFASDEPLFNNGDVLSKVATTISYAFLSDVELIAAFPEIIDSDSIELQQRHLKGLERSSDSNWIEIPAETATPQQRCNYIHHLQYKASIAIIKMFFRNPNHCCKEATPNLDDISQLLQSAFNVAMLGDI